MHVVTALSEKRDICEAVQEIQNQLGPGRPQLVICFASSCYAPDQLAGAMGNGFPGAKVVGCTTAGEIGDGRMLQKSIVAMGFSAEVIGSVAVEVVENLDQLKSSQVAQALGKLAEPFGVDAAAPGPREFAGLVLADGLSRAEEKLMEYLGDLSDVIFVGGSAGDDLKFEKTHVFAGSQAHSNAAVLVLMKPCCQFGVIKSQSFRSSGKILIPTRVNQQNRIVHEFDHRPAAEAYAQALGKSVAEMADCFRSNPLGLMAGREPYVRSPMKVEGDDVHFYCMVREGVPLEVLQSTDIITDTLACLKQKEGELGGIGALINFHCILRTLELRSQGREQDYAALFAPWKNIGLSTYGESYLGHINQTSTMLVFAEAS